MTSNTNTTDSLRRVFYQGFVARDVAEPLASFDETTDTLSVRRFMANRPLTIVGIRMNGIVSGYIERGRLDDRSLGEQAHPLSDATILSTTAPLHEVVRCLSERQFLLVATLGQPAGVIVRDDFEKPPMRMWLFGMVTLFETTITRLVDRFYQDGSWMEFVTESRLEKARVILAERSRRNRSVCLLDCLQLGDKGQLIARSKELREKNWNRSRRQIEKAVKGIEALRNNLAHSQPFVAENWEVIVQMSHTLDRFLDIPAELISQSSLEPYADDNS